MGKHELVLDIIEHPEKYTSEQLTEIMSDPEIREIYNLLCKIESATKANKEADVIAEWEKFSNTRSVRPRRILSWFGSRAATIAAIIGTSIVAVAAGIAVTISINDKNPEPRDEEVKVSASVESAATDTTAFRNDSVDMNLNPVMFENEPLETIMKEIGETYGVEIKFSSSETASLRLYYKFEPSLSLGEVMEQLNTFEQIRIRQNGNVLTID